MEDLLKRLRESNDYEIIEALDDGWKPPPIKDAIGWWGTLVANDPHEHLTDLINLVEVYVPAAALIGKVLPYYKYSAHEFMEESKEDLIELVWNAKVDESKTQRQFRIDMSRADRDIRFYEGRYRYEGWAAKAEDFDDIQAIVRATKVTLQWDQLGKSGYIVYPK